MKLCLVIGLAIITIIIIILILSIMKQTEPYKYNNESPKLIHLIYIPWDKNQKLKDDYLDFDKKSYEQLKRNNPEYNIKLWILPDIQEFVRNFYPEYYDIIFNLPRPTMIVDFLRLLVVYHYGGIYVSTFSKQES
jgi:mannosyltransferase OCH1-like enzyme